MASVIPIVVDAKKHSSASPWWQVLWSDENMGKSHMAFATPTRPSAASSAFPRSCAGLDGHPSGHYEVNPLLAHPQITGSTLREESSRSSSNRTRCSDIKKQPIQFPPGVVAIYEHFQQAERAEEVLQEYQAAAQRRRSEITLSPRHSTVAARPRSSRVQQPGNGGEAEVSEGEDGSDAMLSVKQRISGAVPNPLRLQDNKSWITEGKEGGDDLDTMATRSTQKSNIPCVTHHHHNHNMSTTRQFNCSGVECQQTSNSSQSPGTSAGITRCSSNPEGDDDEVDNDDVVGVDNEESDRSGMSMPSREKGGSGGTGSGNGEGGITPSLDPDVHDRSPVEFLAPPTPLRPSRSSPRQVAFSSFFVCPPQHSRNRSSSRTVTASVAPSPAPSTPATVPPSHHHSPSSSPSRQRELPGTSTSPMTPLDNINFNLLHPPGGIPSHPLVYSSSGSGTLIQRGRSSTVTGSPLYSSPSFASLSPQGSPTQPRFSGVFPSAHSTSGQSTGVAFSSVISFSGDGANISKKERVPPPSFSSALLSATEQKKATLRLISAPLGPRAHVSFRSNMAQFNNTAQEEVSSPSPSDRWTGGVPALPVPPPYPSVDPPPRPDGLFMVSASNASFNQRSASGPPPPLVNPFAPPILPILPFSDAPAQNRFLPSPSWLGSIHPGSTLPGSVNTSASHFSPDGQNNTENILFPLTSIEVSTPKPPHPLFSLPPSLPNQGEAGSPLVQQMVRQGSSSAHARSSASQQQTPHSQAGKSRKSTHPPAGTDFITTITQIRDPISLPKYSILEATVDQPKWESALRKLTNKYFKVQMKSPFAPVRVELEEEDLQHCVVGCEGKDYIINVLRLRRLQVEGKECRLRKRGSVVTSKLGPVVDLDGVVLGEVVVIPLEFALTTDIFRKNTPLEKQHRVLQRYYTRQQQQQQPSRTGGGLPTSPFLFGVTPQESGESVERQRQHPNTFSKINDLPNSRSESEWSNPASRPSFSNGLLQQQQSNSMWSTQIPFSPPGVNRDSHRADVVVDEGDDAPSEMMRDPPEAIMEYTGLIGYDELTRHEVLLSPELRRARRYKHPVQHYRYYNYYHDLMRLQREEEEFERLNAEAKKKADDSARGITIKHRGNSRGKNELKKELVAHQHQHRRPQRREASTGRSTNKSASDAGSPLSAPSSSQKEDDITKRREQARLQGEREGQQSARGWRRPPRIDTGVHSGEYDNENEDADENENPHNDNGGLLGGSSVVSDSSFLVNPQSGLLQEHTGGDFCGAEDSSTAMPNRSRMDDYRSDSPDLYGHAMPYLSRNATGLTSPSQLSSNPKSFSPTRRSPLVNRHVFKKVDEDNNGFETFLL